MVSGIGMDYSAMLNDPIMRAYFMQMMQNSNPSFRAESTGLTTPWAQYTDLSQTETETAAPSTQSQAAFKAQPQEESSGNGLLAGGALAAIVATGACIYAHRAGGGNIIQGFKNIINGWRNKSAAPRSLNIFKKGAANIQEYTINKGGVEILMKDGKPVQIITSKKEVITDATKVADWVRNHSEIQKEVNLLDVTGVLPKGVTLSYTRDYGSFRYVVEKGKVVKAAYKDKSGKWIDVAEDQFENFIKNHPGDVKKAETLEKSLGDKTVRIYGTDGKVTTTNGALKLAVRNGKVVSAEVGGRTLTDRELRMLQNDFGAEIANFGRENPSAYGLKNYEYIYRQNGGQTIRFDGSKRITAVDAVERKTLNTSSEIETFLKENSDINSELEKIGNSGIIPTGYRTGNIVMKSDSSNVYTIQQGKSGHITVTSIKLKDGTTISGKTEIANWLKTAENKNEYDKIVGLVK